MNYNYFVGIDVSKTKLDVSVIVKGSERKPFHLQIKNDETGFEHCVQVLAMEFGTLDSNWFFCLEHTGVYAVPFCCYLASKRLTYTLVPAIQIQKSIGVRRGKNDKTDSRDIARYAMMFCDQIRIQTLPDPFFQQLQILLAERDRFVSAKQGLDTAVNESKQFMTKQMMASTCKRNDRMGKFFDKEIKQIDQEIKDLIKSNDKTNQVFKLITSVVGVGDQTAYHLILITRGFTTFEDPRKLACYCGVAPFEHTSGSSVRGKTRVSPLANKKIKTLLNMCAFSAVQHDPQLNQYYTRKIQEGKHRMSVINAVRNKLLYRIFAVVRKNEPYIKVVEC